MESNISDSHSMPFELFTESPILQQSQSQNQQHQSQANQTNQLQQQQQSNQQQPQDQQQQQQQSQQPPYTIPGILHYLQHEWRRFEMERQEWLVERAELLARISLLQGQRLSNENLRHDLIRRIKMLEYCLKMERAKYHKLKHGTDPPPIEELNNKNENTPLKDDDGFNNSNSTVTYGRELLRHYLQEIGYTDNIIDLRSNRVRSLLGIVDESQSPPQSQSQPSHQQPIHDQQQSQVSQLQDEKSELKPAQQVSQSQQIPRSQQSPPQQQFQQTSRPLGQTTNFKSTKDSNGSSDNYDNLIDIGELAALATLNTESVVSENENRKQWTAEYRLQSHFDCVRALSFSDSDPLLVTASEDETIKLWHLTRPNKSKQPNLPPSINAISPPEGSILDIEPLHTYRGHTSRILSLTVHKGKIYSGAENGELIMWKIITNPSSADQFDKFDSSLLVCRYDGHNDAVWSVAIVEHLVPMLCSVSADETLKFWDILGQDKKPIQVMSLDYRPTCVARIPLYNVSHAGADMAVSSCDGKIRLYDIATCFDKSETNTQPTATFECEKETRINSIVIHPTLPYLASADSNHEIKFWDLKTRNCKSTKVAHQDEVTSLACDPTGKYLLSAGHDCSVRLWLFEEKECIQEITSHRKKFDEGIFVVAFHPSLSHFATGGADGLAKVFV